MYAHYVVPRDLHSHSARFDYSPVNHDPGLGVLETKAAVHGAVCDVFARHPCDGCLRYSWLPPFRLICPPMM